jgi:hypothetical protein
VEMTIVVCGIGVGSPRLAAASAPPPERVWQKPLPSQAHCRSP